MKFFWRTTREASLLSPLASEPDYARFVSETDEVWVTERGSERIEIFSLTGNRHSLRCIWDSFRSRASRNRWSWARTGVH
jgi:hypothetical protein